MEPSHYQSDVFKHLANRGGHSAVISVAGSGKTWTAIEGVGRIPTAYSVLVSAFNVATRDDFKAKGTERKYTHAQYANYNGFGWGICLKNMKRRPELDEFKTANIIEFVTMKGLDSTKFRQPIIKLVSLFKALNYHTVEEADRNILDIVDRFNMDIPDDKSFKDVLLQTWKASMEHLDHFDFDDQKWMPLHLDLPVPCFDQVFVDEFQDTCPVEMELMLKAANGGQFMGLGDPDQCIYGFKGSNPDAFEAFIKRMGAKELPLSICYRCPISVVNEAKKIVPRIESAPNAKQGSVRHIDRFDFLKMVKPGDMVLCRTTDELVKTCVDFIKHGIPGKVRGRDFGSTVEYLMDKVTKGKSLPMAEFITGLKEYQLLRTQQLQDQRRDAEVTRLEDRCDTIRALANECSYSDEIKARMKSVFSEDGKHGGVDLLTIHKSKGLQNPNVFILRPDLLPHPRAKGRSWMLAEERRLKYVGITRAEDSLNWVQEKDGR